MAGYERKRTSHLIYFGHPRESGDPERTCADPTLGSRFRGNDEYWVAALHPKAARRGNGGAT
jgi:hypothetical protein